MQNKAKIKEYVLILISWIFAVLVTRYVFRVLGTDILANTNIKEKYFEEYYHSFLIITFFAFPAFQMLFSNVLLSVMGSVVYAFIPYQIYASCDNELWKNAFLPIVLVLILQMILCNDRKDTFSLHKLVMLNICIFILSQVAVDYTYILLIILMGITLFSYILKKTERRKYLITNMVSVFSILCSIFITSNFINNGHQHYQETTLQGIEANSLLVWKMLIPVYNHRVSVLNDLTRDFYQTTGLENPDSFSNALGLLCTIGFVISLFCVISYQKNKDELIRICGIISLVLVLLFNSVGVQIVLQYFHLNFMDNYLKCIPVISFLSLIVVLRSIELLYLKLQQKGNHVNLWKCVFVVFVTSIMIIALLDQIPGGVLS